MKERAFGIFLQYWILENYRIRMKKIQQDRVLACESVLLSRKNIALFRKISDKKIAQIFAQTNPMTGLCFFCRRGRVLIRGKKSLPTDLFEQCVLCRKIHQRWMNVL